MKWYRLYKESSDSDFVIKNGVLIKPKSKEIWGEVVIPKNVTSIGDYAFNNCNNIERVVIPNNVTHIGKGAFSRCFYLTSVTIPNSVKTIEEDTFYYCKRLTNVTIPNSVTSIVTGAFALCRALTRITIPSSVTTVGAQAFCECRELTSIVVEGKTTKQACKLLEDAVDNISIVVGTEKTDEPEKKVDIEGFIQQFKGMDGITDAYVSTKGIPCIKISTWDVELPEEYVDFRYTVKCKRTLNSSNEKWVPIERNKLSKAVESVIGRFPFTTKNTPDEIEKLIFVLDFTDYN